MIKFAICASLKTTQPIKVNQGQCQPLKSGVHLAKYFERNLRKVSFHSTHPCASPRKKFRKRSLETVLNIAASPTARRTHPLWVPCKLNIKFYTSIQKVSLFFLKRGPAPSFGRREKIAKILPRMQETTLPL